MNHTTTKLDRYIQHVAETISRISPHGAWVCGGAVRDAVLGREPKDFDLFVPVSKGAAKDVAKVVAKHLPELVGASEHFNYALTEGYDAGMRDEVLLVMKPENLNIDIVFFDSAFDTTPEAIVSRFDNSLSMAWFDTEGEPVTSSLFDFSLKHRVILLQPSCCEGARPHLQRVAEKFPQFTILGGELV